MKKTFVAGLAAAVVGGAHAFAAVLLEESFNYPDGPITTVSNGRWSTHSGTTPNQVDITNGAVTLSSSETEDVNAPLAGQPYLATGTVNNFYARFTVRFSSLPSFGGAWFASFKDSTATGFRCRVFAFTTGAASGKFRLGLSTVNNASATVTNLTDLSLNVRYMLVLKLVNTNSASTLWIDPVSEGDPAIVTSESDSTFTVAAFALRQNSGMGTLALDDLVVGTSFAEVTTTPSLTAPVITAQPENQRVTEGGNASLTASATGAAPLRFQWLFNGAPLATGANSSLILTNVTFAQEGEYSVTVTNLLGAVTSAPAILTVIPRVSRATNAAFTLLTYNTHGNMIADWTTNSAQVRAIGRQVQSLNPDIITFQEIPLTNNGVAQMTNFVAAFRPGFHLASNSGTDGFIKSVILSRFPIVRSTKWLDGVNLNSFGYDGTFTRDLFEAEIGVPAWPQPLHVFTTHLKSGQDSDSTARRAAEARAISNSFANGFLATNSLHPYVLTGDMNEDVSSPPSGGTAIPTMTGTGTGLRLTTPLNPLTESHLTFSIRAATLTRRYDYVLPSTLLVGNVTGSQVFRSDLATNIAPALLNDSETASDHLPVLMSFANPYEVPFHLRRIEVTNNTVTLTWNGVPGGRYQVESTTDLVRWTPSAAPNSATGTVFTFMTNSAQPPHFFRIRTDP